MSQGYNKDPAPSHQALDNASAFPLIYLEFSRLKEMHCTATKPDGWWTEKEGLQPAHLFSASGCNLQGWRALSLCDTRVARPRSRPRARRGGG